MGHTKIKNLETLDSVSHAWLVIFGCASIWLLGRREHWRRWVYVAEPTSQPAWLFSGFYHHQWWLVVVSCWYTYSWIQGVWNFGSEAEEEVATIARRLVGGGEGMDVVQKDLRELGEPSCFLCGKPATSASEYTAGDGTVLIYPVCDHCLSEKEAEIGWRIVKDLAEHE